MKNVSLKSTTVLLVVAILACSLVVVAAAATIITSNVVKVTVYPSQGVQLMANATTYYAGDTIQLTAFLSQGLSDRAITFKQGTVDLGTVASVGGVAHLEVGAVNIGVDPITLDFTAFFNA